MITATFDHKGGVGQKSEAGTLSPPRLLPPEAKQASPRRNTLHKNTVHYQPKGVHSQKCTAKKPENGAPHQMRYTPNNAEPQLVQAKGIYFRRKMPKPKNPKQKSRTMRQA